MHDVENLQLAWFKQAQTSQSFAEDWPQSAAPTVGKSEKVKIIKVVINICNYFLKSIITTF